MALYIVNHPIAEHILTLLRDQKTTSAEYHIFCRRLAVILLTKAFENLELKSVTVSTPLCDCEGKTLADDIVLVPILRSGLALLGPALDLLPEVSIGYFGLQRNAETNHSECYYQKLPNITDANVFILDPILATGSSIASAIEILENFKPKSIGVVSIVVAAEGIRHLMSRFPAVDVFTVAIDGDLDEKNFIVPGLGDFGDRFHGTL